MAEEKPKKFYWLRLKEDFFKQHEIKVIEGMDNGKEYVLFYLKLMVESISHEGRLRFADTIPYNEKMLASLTDTNIDIVRTAMKIFVELQLAEILDDQTIYLAEVEKLIGCETADAEKKRKQRALIGQQGDNVPTMSRQCPTENRDKRLEIRDKSLDIREKNIKPPSVSKDTSPPFEKGGGRFVPPTLEEVRAYCEERGNSIDPEEFVAFYESNGWMVSKNKMKSWKSAVITWEKRKQERNANRPEWKREDGGIDWSKV